MKRWLVYGAITGLCACTHDGLPSAVSEQLDRLPEICPDYTGVTIPAGIAPLNFSVRTERKACALFSAERETCTVYASDGMFSIPEKRWRILSEAAKGKQIVVTVMEEDEDGKWKSFRPFTITVSPDSIDPYIAYRLVDPGYQLWGEMGIYQRELASFDEEAVIENRQTDYNCMNCHSFCRQDPGKMLFHVRAQHGCTVLIDGERIETLDTDTEQTISPLVYPFWHPSGRYVAFSVNNTTQGTHPAHRTEVYDTASDVVVYDVEKHELITAAALFSKDRFETFPAFSPDGRQLYFCSAPASDMPDRLTEVRYSLCRIAFEPENGTFGTTVDTLYRAETERRSFLFPRISPDGNYLLGTTTAYGTFPIWHKDADLYMLDLRSGGAVPAGEANSPDTDSYHAWSSNGKWVVFDSRRIDGLYTRLFIAHVGEGGILSKPFALPQPTADYYTFLTKSYNIPEFIRGKVDAGSYRLISRIKNNKRQKITFAK